jgi:hypothetical protein
MVRYQTRPVTDVGTQAAHGSWVIAPNTQGDQVGSSTLVRCFDGIVMYSRLAVAKFALGSLANDIFSVGTLATDIFSGPLLHRQNTWW